MKKWIFFVSLVLSLNVFALEHEVEFVYLGTEEDYEAYYACSYAKEQAQRYLKIMGASDIEVSCTGGLRGPYDWDEPLKLIAKFNQIILGHSRIEMVEIKSDHLFTACAMNTRMIRSFLGAMPRIGVIEKRENCSHPKNPFYYKLSIQY